MKFEYTFPVHSHIFVSKNLIGYPLSADLDTLILLVGDLSIYVAYTTVFLVSVFIYFFKVKTEMKNDIIL